MTMTALPQDQAEATEEPRSRKKLALVVVVVLLLAAGGAWQFLLRPSGPSEPEPGQVLPLTALQVNLAGGHYLRVGLALQLAEGADEVDGSRALDITIDLLSGRTVASVTDPEQRRALKEELSTLIREAYDEEVLEVYFTDFVTQ
ncbi:flagellar basal body-associated FliL family protein [Nocardioides sp. AE5]|uniref:flagellar basal body-associated FliL family protein n=1 Tax=Nocardioides sp. AE5 TaxID=2962573 RepID=UPI0028814915|nr:flagellar basal body-associated FliL family protein [Nocardioides sp. AE5]MDT0200791.1 flagellar basal body-associated FliL family protein [Nocardioides sp. AE5]